MSGPPDIVTGMTNNTADKTEFTPPIGSFQDVDGHRVYVHQEGEGGPAVVFLPGASAVGLDYLHLQQRVAQFTTAVLYDRGGTGYSEPLPLPRTGEQVATELLHLLRAQGVPGPYVLVAHSLGGGYAQRFTQLFPEEVAGLVWIDALHSDWDKYAPPEGSLAASAQMAPSLEQIRELRPALRAMGETLFALHPADVREALTEAHLSDEWLEVGFLERGEHMAALGEELQDGPGFPDVPLIALTVEGTPDAADEAMLPEHLELVQKAREGKKNLDQALVRTVTRGEHRVLVAGHTFLLVEAADEVVQAIHDVVDWARDPR